tara:strand:+ start:69 stop:317 length:249 start_codon:yes stop_codon:yes gene_type:complete
MNLYKISQAENTNYDTYDTLIVIAKNANDARSIHPYRDGWRPGSATAASWASSSAYVNVTLIGKALNTLEEGSVVCASFNAG